MWLSWASSEAVLSPPGTALPSTTRRWHSAGSRRAPVRVVAISAWCCASEPFTCSTCDSSLLTSSRFGLIAGTQKAPATRATASTPATIAFFGELSFDISFTCRRFSGLDDSLEADSDFSAGEETVAVSPAPSAEGTGAASKATTSENLAMKSRVRHSSPVEAVAAPVSTEPASPASSSSPSSEDSTPTRVTPSMSFSAVTNPATASCPVAQPPISSAGPGICERRLPPPPPPLTLASTEALAVRLVSQTLLGRTSESSRITRSQSKRLSARLCTVCTRCSLMSRKRV